MKDGLRRGSCQPGDAFADQVLHALGDVGFFEKGRAISFGVNQLIELFDLVAELNVQRIRL